MRERERERNFECDGQYNDSRASTPSSILFEPMPYGELQNSPRRTAGSGFGTLNGNNKDSIDINVSLEKHNFPLYTFPTDRITSFM